MDDLKKIRKVTGEMEFFIKKSGDKSIVHNKDGRIMGYCDDEYTYKKTGEKISIGADPALLFNKKKTR